MVKLANFLLFELSLIHAEARAGINFHEPRLALPVDQDINSKNLKCLFVRVADSHLYMEHIDEERLDADDGLDTEVLDVGFELAGGDAFLLEFFEYALSLAFIAVVLVLAFFGNLEFWVVFVKGVVGEMTQYIFILDLPRLRMLIILSTQPSQPIKTQIRLQLIDPPQQQIQPKIKFLPIDELRIGYVLLNDVFRSFDPI